MPANSMCDGDSAQGGTNALKNLARMSIKSLRFSVTGSELIHTQAMNISPSSQHILRNIQHCVKIRSATTTPERPNKTQMHTRVAD
jgi:hypothetical protein